MALKNIMRVDNGNVIYSGGSDGTVSFDLMTKLWENPDPTSSFASQNITLSSDDYDMLLWVYAFSTSYSDNQKSSICEKGNSIILDLASYSQEGANTSRRSAERTSSTKYNVSDCYISVGTTASTLNNARIIPIAVYGIKTKQTTKMDVLVTDISTSASKCMMSDGETSVEEAIDEVNDKVDDVESDTLAITGFSNAFILKRVGRICFITYNSTAKSLPAGNLSFSQTIPERFKPLHTVSIYSDRNSVANIMLNFSENGISGYNYGNAVSTTVLCRFGTVSYIALNA